MSKISIVIIIFCTAIIAAVVFFTLREEPGMEDIYLVSRENIEEVYPEDNRIKDFHNADPGIYVIIPVKDVKSGDLVKIEWISVGENSHKTVQKDSIEIEKNGSGNIAAYFLKRDSAYYTGEYKVRAKYNDIQEKEALFTIYAD